MVRLILIATTVFAACLRGLFLIDGSSAPLAAIPAAEIASVLDSEHTLKDLYQYGVIQIQRQQFDATAVFVAEPGLDQMPGIAGIDDDMNGVVDDKRELGATRSDDICRVQAMTQFSRNDNADVKVLQQGAYVPLEASDNSSKPQRALVLGTDHNGRHWSIVVDL